MIITNYIYISNIFKIINITKYVFLLIFKNKIYIYFIFIIFIIIIFQIFLELY